MAKSRFEYVREYETNCSIMDNCWIVVKIERRPSSSDVNDRDLLNYAASKVMKLYREIILTFGGDNEYSFVLHRKAAIYNRRAAKIASCLVSSLTAFYATQWASWMPGQMDLLTPIFYASTFIFPTDDNLKNFLCSRQSMLVAQSDKTLKKFETTFLRKSIRLPNDKSRIHILPFYADFSSDRFWKEHQYLLSSDRPDEYRVEPSILCPLIEQYEHIKYGDDSKFHMLWQQYQLSLAEGKEEFTSPTTDPKFDGMIDWTDYEVDDVVAFNEWIVVRIDGKGFHKFSEKNGFEKPNDVNALDLMNFAAVKVMSFVKDIVISYGQSDEYSFVLSKNTQFCHRRASKIESIINSIFTSQYIKNWSKWMYNKSMRGLPTFDARTVPYSSDELLRDYLSWRQADVHINNLYNTCFWKLVRDAKMENAAAEEYLRVNGTYSADKRKLLLSKFNIEYDELPEMYKKGTILMWKRTKLMNRCQPLIVPFHVDMIADDFWVKNCEILTGEKMQEAEFFDKELPLLCSEQMNDCMFDDDVEDPAMKVDDVVPPIGTDCIRGLLCKCPQFELQHSLVPCCWITIQIRGNGFKRFTEEHEFEKPNDDRGLNLMCHSAIGLMHKYTDIAAAYGHSDVFIFVIQKHTKLYKQTRTQLATLFNDQYVQLYEALWTQWFPTIALKSHPVFTTTVVPYSSVADLKDTMSHEQRCAHEKNLYNTVLWNLVSSGGRNFIDAESEVGNMSIADENECLFQEFGINYNNMPARHKKGTTLLRKTMTIAGKPCPLIVPYYEDIDTGKFWREHCEVFDDDKQGDVEPLTFINDALLRVQTHSHSPI